MRIDKIYWAQWLLFPASPDWTKPVTSRHCIIHDKRHDRIYAVLSESEFARALDGIFDWMIGTPDSKNKERMLHLYWSRDGWYKAWSDTKDYLLPGEGI